MSNFIECFRLFKELNKKEKTYFCFYTLGEYCTFKVANEKQLIEYNKLKRLSKLEVIK